MSSSDLLSRSVGRAVAAALAWFALGGPVAAQNGSWQPGTPLLDPRRLMAAAAVDQTIYTFGGCGSPCFAPPLHTSTEEETRVEIYEGGSWSRSPRPIPAIVFGAAAAAAQLEEGVTKIYLFGGFVTGSSTLIYDPRDDSWRAGRAMPTPRHGLAAVAVNDKVYVLGGSNGTNAVAALEVYDPVHDTWEQLDPMPTARVFLAAAAVGGKIYAIGGSPDCCANGATNVVEVYDTVQRTWSPDPLRPVPSLPEALQTSAAAAFGGKIYVLGGFVPGQGATGSTYELDPAAPQPTWTAKLSMPEPRDQAPAVALADGIHVLGGSTNCHCSPRRDHPTFVPSRTDLKITKTGGPANVCPGETVSYRITVTNEGTSPVHGARVDDPADDGNDLFRRVLPGATWTCAASGPSGTACGDDGPTPAPIHDHRVELPVGGTVTYEVTGTVALDATGSFSNSAQVRPPEGIIDDDPTDDVSAPVDSEVHRDRLEIRKTEVPARDTVAPGDSLLYEIRVCNRCASPQAITVEDKLSEAGLLAPQWCREVGLPCALSDGDLLDVALVPADSCVTYRASGKVPCDCRNPVTTIDNVAFARLGENEVSDRDVNVVGPPSDRLAVDIVGPSVLTGCAGDYTIKVTNSGPCTAPDVVLDVVPSPGLSLVSLAPSGNPSTGTVALNDIEAGPVVITARIEAAAGLQCPIAPQRIRATVRSGCGQPAAEDSLDVLVPCDLGIAKTDGLDTAAPGDCIGYCFDVTNPGCGSVDGATVTDNFPLALESIRWCRGVGCTPVPDGPLVDILDLPRGGSETYCVAAAIVPSFSGTLLNTASVVMPAGVSDAQPGNNTSTDTTAVVPDPGVAALCAGMEGGVLEGDVVTFIFVLWNGGPAAQGDNPGDELVDVLPAGLTLVSAAASSGIVMTPPNTPPNTVTWNGVIPVGGSVTIEVKATVDVGTVGMTLCNVATVFFDADGDGSNESSALSDGCHSCCVTVVPVPLIPTLSKLAIAALALLLAALALARLRPGSR